MYGQAVVGCWFVNFWCTCCVARCPPALQADSSVESCSRVVVIWVSSMKWFLALSFLPWFAHAFRIVQHAAVQTSKNGASIPSMDDLQELRFCVHPGVG